MPAENVVPVVLSLPGVHDAALRSIGRRTPVKQRWIIEGHSAQRLADILLNRNTVADGVPAEFHVQPAKADSDLVRHPRSKRSRPADSRALRERGDVGRKARSGGAESIRIEEGGLVVNIPHVEVVLRELDIHPVNPVIAMGTGRERALNAPQFYVTSDTIRARCYM